MIIWIHNKKKMIEKSFSLRFNFHLIYIFYIKSNGALKGRKEDFCYDLNIRFCGIHFNYTNWNFNKEFRYSDRKIKYKKLKLIN